MASTLSSFATGTELSPERNLTRYLQHTRNKPMLSFEDEQEYARRWIEDQDEDAVTYLVDSHLRLVVKIAVSYKGYGLPIEDLIAEGNIGLLQAVRRFDPSRGFRLATYAMWWIRAAIQEYVLHSWSMVKIGTTAAQKKLFFNLRRIKNRLGYLDDGDLQPAQVTQIATDLKVSEEEVVNMNRRMMAHDGSLNATLNDDSGDEWQDMLADEGDGQEDELSRIQELSGRKKLLAGAMEGLSERERHIFEHRRLFEAPETLDSLSQHFGISRERVRQIEVKAFNKVKKSVRNQAVLQNVQH